MKPPDHPVPSGDRTMARLLNQALETAGQEVTLACRLRSREPTGNLQRQARLQAIGAKLAARYVKHHRTGARPDLWFTYHLYYKAPDWVGPLVSRQLGIPYVVTEASVAPKRAGGPWDLSHRAVLSALDQATVILPLTPRNAACLPHPERHHNLPPFLRLPTDPAAGELANLRDRLALPMEGAAPLLVTAAMMRPGAKLASYRLLAESLKRIADRPWNLMVLGDGPARGEVEAAFAPLGARVRFLGEIASDRLVLHLRLGCLFVWPAVEEAYGMAILEAMAAGLPVVAGDEGGVSTLVEHERTGLLTDPRDAGRFASSVQRLLEDSDCRARMGKTARQMVSRRHSLQAAAQSLQQILQEALQIGARRPWQEAQ